MTTTDINTWRDADRAASHQTIAAVWDALGQHGADHYYPPAAVAALVEQVEVHGSIVRLAVDYATAHRAWRSACARGEAYAVIGPLAAAADGARCALFGALMLAE